MGDAEVQSALLKTMPSMLLAQSRPPAVADSVERAAVAVSEDATKTSDSTRVEEAAAQLAAALRYNGLSLDDGFSAVDTDDDGKIVLDDMRAAAEQLGLQVGRV